MRVKPPLYLIAMSKVSRTETSGDGPLSQPEIGRASSLLLRAVKHGQSQQIVKMIQDAPHGKPYWVNSTAVLTSVHDIVGGYPATGASSMTDASKRRVPDDTTSWENVSATSESFCAGCEAESRENLTIGHECPSILSEACENRKIPIPAEIKGLADWGNCICECDKYKSLCLSYFDLLDKAKWDPECSKYLSWLKNRYGYDPNNSQTEQLTPGRDLARFLQRFGWNEKALSTGFVRRFKGQN